MNAIRVMVSTLKRKIGIATEYSLYFLIQLKQSVSAMFDYLFLLVSDIAVDTLQKDDAKGVRRWDRMKMTMLVCFMFAIFYAAYDLWTFGFRFEVFFTFIGAALGNKIIDAHSKRLEK